MKVTFLKVEQLFRHSGPAPGSRKTTMCEVNWRGFKHKAHEQQMLQLSIQRHWMRAKNLLSYC